MQRITDFSHIVPVRKIDITVGTRAPRLAEPDRTATVPLSGDIRPLAKGLRQLGAQPTTPVRTLSRDEGVVIDVWA